MDGVIDRHRVNTLALDPEDPFDRAFEDLAVEHYGEGKWVAGVRAIRVRDEWRGFPWPSASWIRGPGRWRDREE